MIFGFVGLGLMGGALARSVKEKISGIDGKILATDKNYSSLNKAKEEGIVDEIFLQNEVPAMLSRCDIVFMCIYPSSTASFICDNMQFFKSGSLITDIAGVKNVIVDKVLEKIRDDVDFIPGHPMAGSEKEGFENSSLCNFSGRNYILVPLERNKKENISLLKDIIYRIGFSNIVETTVENHDNKIAFTSQLCHVIASALVESAEDNKITSFGGGSFEDLTRIAMINAPMWTELFIENKGCLLKHIEKFEAELSKLKNYIENEDSALLSEYLKEVRQNRIEMAKR